MKQSSRLTSVVLLSIGNAAWNSTWTNVLTQLYPRFASQRDKVPVHVVVDPVLGQVLRPHQREVSAVRIQVQQ